jgi:hypothetical protein
MTTDAMIRAARWALNDSFCFFLKYKMPNDLAREAVLQPSSEMPDSSTTVRGFSDYTENTDYSALLTSFHSTGFQGISIP